MVQVFTKPVYGTSLHKTSLMVNNERNVHGQNITKEYTWKEHYQGKGVQTMCKMCAKCVQTVCLLCANCVQTVCKLCANCVVGISFNKL